MYLKEVAPEDRTPAHAHRILSIARGEQDDYLAIDEDGCLLAPGLAVMQPSLDSGWPVIKEAPSNLQEALARQVVIIKVKEGKKIMAEGQKVTRSYFVVHGEVAIKETFGNATNDVKVQQPFHLRTIGIGGSFGELPKGPREPPKIAPTVVAKSESLIFYIEHSKYWSLVQGQKEADDSSRKIELLRSLHPAWGDKEDTAAHQKRDAEIAKMGARVKLKRFEEGQTIVQQGKEVGDIYFVVSGEIHVHIGQKSALAQAACALFIYNLLTVMPREMYSFLCAPSFQRPPVESRASDSSIPRTSRSI